MIDVIRCDKGYLSKDQFTEYIFQTLLTYKFADAETLSSVMRARKNDIVTNLEQGLIDYIHENPNVKVQDVCKKLKVNTSFIYSLIEQERLIIKEGDISDLDNEVASMMEEARVENEKIQRMNSANALQRAINSKPVVTSERTGVTFHTKDRYSKK